MMKQKKYKLLKKDSICVGSRILYRIKALKKFGNVKKGDLGGYIEKEENLSHYGDCWVGDTAKVYEKAFVFGNAYVGEDSRILGFSEIYGNAKIYGRAVIEGYYIEDNDAAIHIYDNVKILGNSYIGGRVSIGENAYIHDQPHIYGEDEGIFISGSTIISGKSYIHGNNIFIYERSIITGNSEINGENLSLVSTEIGLDMFISSNRDFLTINNASNIFSKVTFGINKNKNIFCSSHFMGIMSFEDFMHKLSDEMKEKDELEYLEKYVKSKLLGGKENDNKTI